MSGEWQCPNVGSDPDEEVVQEEATTPDEVPSGLSRVKPEPDC